MFKEPFIDYMDRYIDSVESIPDDYMDRVKFIVFFNSFPRKFRTALYEKMSTITGVKSETVDPFLPFWKDNLEVFTQNKIAISKELDLVYSKYKDAKSFDALHRPGKSSNQFEEREDVAEPEEESNKKRKQSSSDSGSHARNHGTAGSIHAPHNNGNASTQWSDYRSKNDNRPSVANNSSYNKSNKAPYKNKTYRRNDYQQEGNGSHNNHAPSYYKQSRDFKKVNRLAIKPPTVTNDPVEVDMHPVSAELFDINEFNNNFKQLELKTYKQNIPSECKYRINVIHSKMDDHPILTQNPLNPLSPVLIEEQRLMALVDTGADVSIINKNILRKNKHFHHIKINPIRGQFMLAKKGAVASRDGTTSLLNVSYNGHQHKHSFEILELDDGIDVILGRDIFPFIGVTLNGVAVNWDDNKIVYDDSIDDSEYQPNVSYAGTEHEHKTLIYSLQKYIDENQKIDVRSFCNIPESVVHLPTPPGKVAYRKQYPIADSMMSVVDESIAKWLLEGTIIRSNTPSGFNNPLTISKKKDLQGNPTAFRVCLDPRELNTILLDDDKYPLPLINDIFDDMQGASVFTTLDLKSAFNRFQLAVEDQHKTTFTHRNVQYHHVGAPFGIKTLTSKFSRVMDIILNDMKSFSRHFVDDVCIFSRSVPEHFSHVKRVITALTQSGLILNPEKCHFGMKSTYLLGFCISEQGRSLDTRKLSNLHDYSPPTNGKQMQRFLGLINYLRDHIPMAAHLTAPLDALRHLETSKKIVWNDTLNRHFRAIIDTLVSNVVLKPVDPSKPMHVITDASNYGIGAALYQETVITNKDGKKITHVAYNGFMARSLSKSERNYPTTKRELLAIVFALKKFHKFVYGRHFTVHTDHRCLTYLLTQDTINPMMTRWIETILTYDFDVVYVPGILNILSDKLSRIFMTTLELEGGSEISDDNKLEEKRKDQKQKHNSGNNAKVFYIQNPTKFSDKNYVTPPEADRKDILDDAHKFGHFGADHIVKHIHNNDMHWPNLLSDAVKYVSQCPTCQKYNIHKRGYNPQRPVYSYMPGDSYAMDLAGPFKSFEGKYTYLLIVVDVCTRFVMLDTLVDKTAKSVATALIKMFSLVGYPRHFSISDNGTEFKNQLIHTMFKLMAIDKRHITAYHPASNLSERFVQSTKKVLAKLMEGQSGDWHYYVPSVQLMMNNKVSKRLNTTPFSLMFARRMNDFINYDDNDGNPQTIPYMSHEDLMDRIDYMSSIVFPAISERTKAYINLQKGIADKKHILIDFPEGSHVMLRVRDRYNNLSPAYQGPYTVVRKTEGGTYILNDEEGILMSRAYTPEELKLISQDQLVSVDELYTVESIITHRGSKGHREYLVRWKNYSKDHDSWIPPANFTDPEMVNQYWRRLGVKPTKEELRKEKEKYSPPKNYKRSRLLQNILDNPDVIPHQNNNRNNEHQSSQREDRNVRRSKRIRHKSHQ